MKIVSSSTASTLLFVLFSFHGSYGIKAGEVYGVPALDREVEHDYLRNIFNVDPGQTKAVTAPPLPFMDLGQGHCVQHLQKALAAKGQSDKIRMLSASNGAATTINYLATSQDQRVEIVVLESAFASANSAIEERARYFKSYYWAPYLCKLIYPFYSPTGLQPIKSIGLIPKNTAVVIISSENDHSNPLKNAQALYYALKSQGRDNVYFIQQKGDKHLEIMKSMPKVSDFASSEEGARVEAQYKKDKNALSTMIAKHTAGAVANLDEDLSDYQPNVATDPIYKQCYDELMARELNHEKLAFGLKITGIPMAVCAVLYIGYRLISRYTAKADDEDKADGADEVDKGDNVDETNDTDKADDADEDHQSHNMNG